MPRRLVLAFVLALGIVTIGAPFVGAAAGPSTSDIARLSRPLATYLAGLRSRAGVSVVNISTGARYAYNPSGRFIKASTIKVALAMAAYERSRRLGIPLTGTDLAKMAVMIQVSDNASATYFWDKIGGPRGLAAYFARIGVSGWAPWTVRATAWGYSSENPVTGSQVLEKLWRGQAGITAAARSHILSLMRSITSSQRWALGGAAPKGSSVAEKNGWVIGPDGRWAVNGTAIVVESKRTWLVTVYANGNASYAAGLTAVHTILRLVAAGVLAH
jgi:beta-lactamase class A